MRDKVKFHNMTKPIRFRKLKLFKNATVLWCKALRERINYLINYILYKLNILKRFSYRDNMEKVLPLPHTFRVNRVETDYFRGTVCANLVEEKDIEFDYFYREKKNGDRNITLSLKNEEDSRLFISCHLEDIHIKVGGKWFDVNSMPIFRIGTPNYYRLKPFNSDLDTTKIPRDYETVTYDIGVLRKLNFKGLIGVSMTENDISKSMQEYYYKEACSSFKGNLESLSLRDLMVQEGK